VVLERRWLHAGQGSSRVLPRVQLTIGSLAPLPEGSPAATVVLLRDGTDGMETLLLHRHPNASFAAGSAVFPGGRVDDDDWHGVAPGDSLEAARRAAVRETLEEAGLILEPTALVPFSHWTPPPQVARKFLTWFFVASAPDAVVAVDGTEIVDHVWLRPADALAMHGRDELDLMHPTWVTVEWLARQPSTAAAIDAAASREPQSFAAQVFETERGSWCLFEGDTAYDAAAPDLDAPGPRRRIDTSSKPWRWIERA
jgi:8-oxo-dGTP pyrophosphatase MutT (NUDIX family)